MAKYYGNIGFAESTETTPGVWVDVISEKYYSGDIKRDTTKFESSEGLNNNLNISNRVSIIADQFAEQNLCNMRYIVWRGVKWEIKSIDVNPPRHILTLGGVYNG